MMKVVVEDRIDRSFHDTKATSVGMQCERNRLQRISSVHDYVQLESDAYS